MKRIFTALAFASVLLLGACADESEQITGRELGEKFQRGVRGEGQLGPRDRSDDPYVREGVPQTHP